MQFSLTLLTYTRKTIPLRFKQISEQCSDQPAKIRAILQKCSDQGAHIRPSLKKVLRSGCSDQWISQKVLRFGCSVLLRNSKSAQIQCSDGAQIELSTKKHCGYRYNSILGCKNLGRTPKQKIWERISKFSVECNSQIFTKHFWKKKWG